MKVQLQRLKKLICSSFFVLSIVSAAVAQQPDLMMATSVIKQHAAKIGLSENDLSNYRIADAYRDKLSGATIYYLQQTYKGIDVLNAIQTVAIKNNVVVSVTGKRIPNMEVRANVKNGIPVVTAENAIRIMVKHLKLTAPAFITALRGMDDKKVVAFSDLGISSVPVKSKLIWLAGGKTKTPSLSWQVEVQPKGVPDYWLVHVDADKGLVLGKMNLNVSCAWNKDGNKAIETHDHSTDMIVNLPENVTGVNAVNSATYRVIPFPAESPFHTGGSPALVTNPWELAGAGNNATSLKWHDDGVSIYDSTRGNNVWALEDRSKFNDTLGKKAGSSTSAPDLTFDFEPDFVQQPTVTVNQNFAITNLFYWNNIMHDISYQYGFDENAGNFQANNQSRGGLDNDFVWADAQDNSGSDNANFATPPDGSNPRMQMFLFSGSPKIDGDLDNGVIAHEYGHGISNRLTGGPSNVACLQNAEQMGEGWSDYLALMVTTDWKIATINDGPLARTIGTYVLNQQPSGSGIRWYPYSTDMNINPWTYADLKGLFADPNYPIYPESHLSGEIWSATLWDMTWNIIEMDGINTDIYAANKPGGNSVAFTLVMEGMKLQPCSPGFIDGRDAILKADTLLYAGKYSCAIWKAFTRRGMVFFASQGGSDIWKDEVADFASMLVTKTVNKDSFVQQEQVTYLLKVKGAPCVAVSNYTLVDTLPANVTYISSTGGSYNAVNRTVTFNINLSGNSEITHTIIVTVNDGSYAAPVQHVNEVFASATLPAGWTPTSTTNNKWIIKNNASHSSPYSLFIGDADSTVYARFISNASFPLTQNSILSFWHSYNSEPGWDGGWVEISTNNGATYTDLNSYIIQNAYQNTVNYNNVARSGFSGNSNGFIKTVVDLSSFTGKSVKFRFVFSSDESVGGEGWYVDDINLVSESGISNLGQLFNENSELIKQSSAYSKITEGTLPVTWGDFTAVKQGNISLLKWQILQEYNTSKFVIERSTDGVNFYELGSVAAKGNSTITSTYQFTDQLPLNGKDHYRIKQVDKDGKFAYSPVKSLDFLLNRIVTITPNPAKDVIRITVTGNDKPLKVYMISPLGKEVGVFNMTGQYLQVNLPNIPAGVYYVKITGEGSKHIQKLVIQ